MICKWFFLGKALLGVLFEDDNVVRFILLIEGFKERQFFLRLTQALTTI